MWGGNKNELSRIPRANLKAVDKSKEMIDKQKLYENAPLWLQNIAVNVEGRIICKRRYNNHFYDELKRFEEHDYKPAEELRRFLCEIQDVPAYKDIFTSAIIHDLSKESSDVYAILDNFPIIGKMQVKEHIEDYTNQKYKGKLFTMRTSGTTGSGLAFPYPVDFENKQWAVWWRFRRLLGIQFDTWCGWFGGKRMMAPNCNKPPFWRINYPGRQVMYSSYHMTEETIKLFYEDLKERKLEWLHGYPSHIAKLSALIVDQGLAPLTGVKWITTGAEGLVGNQIKLIEKAFPESDIRSHYGQNEGVAVLNQDANGEWYVEDDFSYVEFIPLETNLNVCRIVGTGFQNPAFPLIRYDTGDLATVERNEDGTIRRIVSIDGRTSNTVKQPSGHEISEAALSIVLHDFDNIKEAQFHQIAIGEVVLWVVKGLHYSDKDELHLKEALYKAFDRGMKISLKYVEAVERTKAGKLRLIITEMK